MYVDVHCHLDHELLKVDEVIKRARKAGVKKIITNGVNPRTNRIALELANKYNEVEAALGIYPDEAGDIDEEINFIRENKIVAIGEIGLDYAEEVDRERQKSVFEKQLKLAEELKLPVIVHSRKAELDVIEMLEERKLKVIMHCFCGKKNLVKRVRDNKWYFSIPTNVVRAQNFQQIVSNVPMNQILTETDAPFLSPFRGEVNEPANVVESVKVISRIKEMEQEEVKNMIYYNFQRVFL